MDSLDHHHHRRPSFFPSMYHTKRQQTTYNNEIKYNLWAKIYSNRVETNIFYSFKNLVSLPLSLFFRYVASAHHFISLARSICVLFVVTVSCHSRKKPYTFFAYSLAIIRWCCCCVSFTIVSILFGVQMQPFEIVSSFINCNVKIYIDLNGSVCRAKIKQVYQICSQMHVNV